MTQSIGLGMAPDTKDLAVLIPTRNRSQILRRTLVELKRAGFGARSLIVYDDASEDQDAVSRVVREEWPKASLIRGTERIGQAAGRNRLLNACSSELALCLDDDCFPDSGVWGDQYLNADWCGKRWAVVTFQCVRLRDGEMAIKGSPAQGNVTGFLGGACMMHVPSVLSTGGYRDFFMYGCEEPELALRLRLAGFCIWQDPLVVVRHNQFDAPDEKRDSREYDYLYARNTVLLYSLNFPLSLGLILGAARSLRHLLFRRRNWTSSAKGLWDGVVMTFARRQDRRPCTWRQARQLTRSQGNAI